MSESKIEYQNTDGVNVTDHIKKGKTKLFETREEAYEYSTLKRSYLYPVNVYEKIGGNWELTGCGYAVPQ